MSFDEIAARWRCIVVGFGCVLLAACDPAPSLYIVNNSGRTVEVLHAESVYTYDGATHTDTWDRHVPWSLRIKTGERREVMYMMSTDPKSRWIIRLGRGNCAWIQEIPNRIYDAYYSAAWERFHSNPVDEDINRVVQMEPDGTIYVVPAGATSPIDVAEVANIQPSGFPLSGPQQCRF